MRFRNAGIDHGFSLYLAAKGEVFDQLKKNWLMERIQRRLIPRFRREYTTSQTDETTTITHLFIQFISLSDA